MAEIKYEDVVITDDMLIALSMLGAGMTALGVALGAAKVAETVIDELGNPIDSVGKATSRTIKVAQKGPIGAIGEATGWW